MKSAARRILRSIPLPLYRLFIRRDMLVFLYHLVGRPDLPHVRHLYPYKSPEAFENDLIYLARHFHMVACDEIVPGRRSGRPRAHLTFDDGYAECETEARRLLLKHGVPCTFFLTTDLIDNRSMFHRNTISLCIEAILALPDRRVAIVLDDLARRAGRPFADREAFRRWILALGPHEQARLDEVSASLGIDVPAYLKERRPYMSSDQVRRLRADGFTLGAHAKRHVPLGSLPESAAEDEILGSCREVRGWTGLDTAPFAFPHSADGVDRAFLRRLITAHPSVGRLFDTHQLRRDDLVINRITADAPPVPGRGTNIPALLHAAYREVVSAALRGWLIGSHPG